MSGDFLRPTVLCSELLGNRQIGNAQRQPIPSHLCKICFKNSLGSDSIATNGSKAQDDKAVLKRLEQTSQTPSRSTFAFAVNPGCTHGVLQRSKCFPCTAASAHKGRGESNLGGAACTPSKWHLQHTRTCRSSMKAFTEDLLVLDLQVQTGYSQATYFADEALHF